jgi:cardiolipin synthase
MEEMYLEDLANSTEVVLDSRHRVRAPRPANHVPRSGGSAGRAATGLLRIRNTVGAAITDRRVLEPIEGRIMTVAAVLLLSIAALAVLFPRALAYPAAAVATWIAGALLYQGFRQRQRHRTKRKRRSRRRGPR